MIRSTIEELVDAIMVAKLNEDSADLGVGLFDNLPWQQQLAMLLKVTGPLLDSSLPPPKATALMDATVGAIYAQMFFGVEYEIETQRDSLESFARDTVRRQEMVRALRERRPDQTWLDSECVVLIEWEIAIAEVQSWVLADEDWKLAGLALDAPVDQASQWKVFLGIDGDYFVDIPPDPDDREMAALWADLKQIVTGERPSESVFG